jgi:hypothetical protein
MAAKYIVNQRVRELMKALGYKGDKLDAHHFGQKVLGEGKRTEVVKNAYRDKNGISAEILRLITTNIVNDKGQKVNGHWLLTGEGSMFLDEKSTLVMDDYQKEVILLLREKVARLEGELSKYKSEVEK